MKRYFKKYLYIDIVSIYRHCYCSPDIVTNFLNLHRVCEKTKKIRIALNARQSLHATFVAMLSPVQMMHSHYVTCYITCSLTLVWTHLKVNSLRTIVNNHQMISIITQQLLQLLSIVVQGVKIVNSYVCSCTKICKKYIKKPSFVFLSLSSVFKTSPLIVFCLI